MRISIFGLPFLAFAHYARRDDTDGGGDPSDGSNGGNNPKLTNWVSQPGRAPVAPSHDDFYSKIPSDLTKYKNGQIIDKRNVSVAGTYAGADTAYQIKYRTEDAHSAAAVTIASLLIPRSERLNGNVVVFQVPEDSVSIDCSPTYQLFGKNAIPEVQSLISQGYAVVVPDYEGERGSYTVGKLAGKQILDSARAALAVPNIKQVNQTVGIGLWGYGTGAYSTGWAAEIAQSYAPEIPIKGAAVGGYITDLLDWMNNINNSPSAGNLVSSLLGMATEYNDIVDSLQDGVIPRRRSQFDSAGTHCATDNVLHFFNTNITAQYFSPGVDLLRDSKVKNVYNLNALGQTAPKINFYVYQGGNDREVSKKTVHATLSTYCKGGTNVKYREYSGQSHSQTRSNYNDALNFFGNVFNGTSIENSCSKFKEGDYSN